MGEYDECYQGYYEASSKFEYDYDRMTEVVSANVYSDSSKIYDATSALSSSPVPKTGRPLRVIHVGQYMFRAGIESWLKSLICWSNPERIEFRRCVVTSKIADPNVVAQMGVPVEIGEAASVRQAAEDCDVLLCSGPAELATWLGDKRPPLCLFVAHGESPWTRRILDASLPIVDHVVAVSKRVQKIACHGLSSTVIYNGVDLGHLVRSRSRESVRESLGFAKEDFVLGYVGRLSSEKRPHTIIEAVARLPRNFKALIVGWGHLHQKLMDLANDQIPGRCVFRNGDQNIGDYYGAMDAFCLNSEWEGFGLVLLEAMFSELPVICGPIGFAPECLKNRVNCVIVNGESKAVSKAALMLQQHPDWARGLAREGKDYAERNGHARLMASRYEELIERLWAKRMTAE